MVRVGRIAEHHLAEIGAAVLDLGAIALDDRAEESHRGVERVRCRLGGRTSGLERDSVVRVLHEQQQLALRLGVQEQRARADICLLGDLLGGDVVDAVLREQLSRGRGDALELLLLVALAAPEGRCWGRHLVLSGI